jgi:hypothetical protein
MNADVPNASLISCKIRHIDSCAPQARMISRIESALRHAGSGSDVSAFIAPYLRSSAFSFSV